MKLLAVLRVQRSCTMNMDTWMLTSFPGSCTSGDVESSYSVSGEK